MLHTHRIYIPAAGLTGCLWASVAGGGKHADNGGRCSNRAGEGEQVRLVNMQQKAAYLLKRTERVFNTFVRVLCMHKFILFISTFRNGIILFWSFSFRSRINTFYITVIKSWHCNALVQRRNCFLLQKETLRIDWHVINNKRGGIFAIKVIVICWYPYQYYADW